MSQEDAVYANEVNHCIANLGLCGALFMIIGLRSDEEDEWHTYHKLKQILKTYQKKLNLLIFKVSAQFQLF